MSTSSEGPPCPAQPRRLHLRIGIPLRPIVIRPGAFPIVNRNGFARLNGPAEHRAAEQCVAGDCHSPANGAFGPGGLAPAPERLSLGTNGGGHLFTSVGFE